MAFYTINASGSLHPAAADATITMLRSLGLVVTFHFEDDDEQDVLLLLETNGIEISDDVRAFLRAHIVALNHIASMSFREFWLKYHGHGAVVPILKLMYNKEVVFRDANPIDLLVENIAEEHIPLTLENRLRSAGLLSWISLSYLTENDVQLIGRIREVSLGQLRNGLEQYSLSFRQP